MGNLDIGLSTHTQAKRALYEINPQHISAYQYQHPPKPAEWHFCHYVVDDAQLFLLYTTYEIFYHFIQLISCNAHWCPFYCQFQYSWGHQNWYPASIFQVRSRNHSCLWILAAEDFSQLETEKQFEWTIAREDRIVNNYWTRLSKISWFLMGEQIIFLMQNSRTLLIWLQQKFKNSDDFITYTLLLSNRMILTI